MCILEFDATQHWLGMVWFHLSSTPPEVWAPTSRWRGNCRAVGLSLPTSHTDQERSLHPPISESRALPQGPHSLPWWMLDPYQQFSSESSLPAWWRRRASEIRGGLAGGGMPQEPTASTTRTSETTHHYLFTAAQRSHSLECKTAQLGQMSKHLALITFPPLSEQELIGLCRRSAAHSGLPPTSCGQGPWACPLSPHTLPGPGPPAGLLALGVPG